MSLSNVAVGNQKPSYLTACIAVLNSIGEITLPSICTTTTRCLSLCAIIPLAIAGLSIQFRIGIQNTTIRYFCWILLVLISLGAVGLAVIVDRFTRMHIIHRKAANPQALEIVRKGIESKRIIREEQYDVYVPPKRLGQKSYSVGFFMLPGALLEHNVYAAILAKLSDAGILTMVQNCEPLRLASEFYSSNEKSIRKMIEEVEKKHGLKAERWAVGGHSWGGHTAVVVAKKSDFFQSLVMYGVNASHELEKEGCSIRALAMTASKDGLQHSPMANLSTFDHWGEGETKGRLHYVVIEGGNHSGFGDYPLQSFPMLDGERTISLEEQHQQIVDATVKFLLPKQE